MMTGTKSVHRVRALATILTTICAGHASAATPVGNADAYDLSIQIDILGLTQFNLTAPTSASIIDATESVSDSQSLASIVDADPLNLITLSTGALSSEAEYVAGSLSAVAARASVEDLELQALGLLDLDILSLQGGTISSQVALAGFCPEPPAQVNGLLDDFVFYSGFDQGNLVGGDDGSGGEGGGVGGLPPTGATLIDVQLGVLGIDVPALPLNPDPNTAIDLGALGIAGATLILNEQTRSGDGVSSLAVASNALRLTLDVAGLVTANVIIAHSGVSLDCPQ
jgi:hypothetical protein